MKSSIFNIFKQIEDDASKLDINPEMFKWFDPLLWIESNEKLFFLSILDLSTNNPTELYLILLNELSDRFSKILNANNQTSCSKLQLPAIMTLIIWEIILHIPIKKRESSNKIEQISELLANFVFFDYSQVYYSKDYIFLFKKLHQKVLQAANFVGTSVISKVFSKIDELKTDPIIALNQLSITICSGDTLKYFISNTEKLLLSVNKQDKPTFYDNYYDVLSTFLLNHPQIRQCFVIAGMEESTTLFFTLSKSKVIEVQLLPILCILLPFITPRDKTISDKSKKYIQPMFKSIQGFGSKKDPTAQNRYLTSFIELLEGVSFSNDTENEPFVSITKFIEKNLKEFENLLYSNISDSHPDQPMLSLLVRYAVYDFVHNKEKERNIERQKPIDLMIEKSVSCQSWSFWEKVLQFFIHIFSKWSHHPRYKNIIGQFQKAENQEQIFNISINKIFLICKSCIGIINRVLDDESCAIFVSKLTELFEYAPIEFSVYSAFELQNSEFSVEKEVNFPYQTQFLFEDQSELETFIKFLLGLVSISYKVNDSNLLSVVSCLRNIWTFNKKSIEGKENKTILNHVSEIVKVFCEVIKSSINEFFNDLVNYNIYPYLFYRFLHWSYCALNTTLETSQNNSRFMNLSIIQNFLNTSLIIHAIASDSPTKKLAYNCDRLIKQIIKLYNVDLNGQNFITYSTVADEIEKNASLLSNITGEMFDFWLKFVKKQIDEVEKVLFIDKSTVNESVITHAFLASTVSMPLMTLNSSFAQSKDSISLGGITSISNPSLTTITNSSVTLLASTDGQVRKLITNQHLISSVTSFLCKFIGTLKNDIFNKLINKINFSSKIGENENANENENVLREFFSACLSYVNALPKVDKSFTSSFSALSDDSVRIFIDLSASRLLKRVQNFQYDRPYFWLNFIHICITLASRPVLTHNIIEFINDVIPIFFSTIEFDAFPNMFISKLINSICILISTFYNYIFHSINNDQHIFDHSLLYSKQRLTIYSILEICINFAHSDHIIFHEILPTVLNTLSSLFKNLNLDVTSSNNNVDDVSSEERFTKDVIFFLSFFNSCIQETQNVDVISCVLKCMNYIINNNPSSWPIYAYYANTSSQLFKALLIESLTLVCGSVFHSQTDYENMIAPLDEANSNSNSNNNNNNNQKDKTLLKSQREKMEVNYLLYSVKAKMESSNDDYNVFNLTKPFPYKKLTKPFDILTNNNFAFFKSNNIFNLRFLEACISCVVFYNMHDNLFEEMVKEVKNDIFDSQNSVSCFFTAWFLYSVRKWQLIPLINSISIEEPNDFVVHFDPPPFFVYYISKFAKMKSNSICKEMFLKCFLKPLISCPLTYDVKKFIPPQKAEEFIEKLIKLPQYDKLLSIILETDMLYPVTDNDHFPIDRDLVLSFISERPKAIDKLYGMIDKESYNKIQSIDDESRKILTIQDINYLSVSDWIKDAGMINDSRVIYIKISNIRVASPSSIADDFFNHFSSSSNNDKLIFLVDLSCIPEKDQLFEAFQKIIEQSNEQFTKRIDKIYLINPSMDTTQLLNEKLGEIIQLNWVNKYEIVENVASIIPKDSKVYLPISLFRSVKEQKYSFNTKYQNEMASFSVCDDYFILSTNRSLFINNKILNRIRFPISSIMSLKEVNDNKGRCVLIQARYCKTKEKEYRIETEHSNAILFVYNLLEQRYNFGLTGSLKNNENPNKESGGCCCCKKSDKMNEILMTISPSLQSQMLAFSIYQMSSSESIKALGFQVYQLFDSAFNFDQSNGFQLAKSMSFDRENLINLSVLFNMIEKKSMQLLENVAFSVSLYLNQNTTSESIQNLIPLFIKFINTTTNRSLMTKVLSNILKASRKQPHISILERFFFSKFTSELAFEITIPILIRASKGIKAREMNKNEGFIENVYIEIYLQSLMNANPKLVCEIIEKNLNGAVSKRSFGNLFPTDKVLSTIVSLPFHSKEFLSNNLGLFFFCSLLEGIYDPPGVINYTKKCYNMIFSLLLHFKTGKEVSIMQSYMQMIMKMIENPRILKLSELISCIDQLLTLLDENQHETFRSLLINLDKDHCIRNWYVKGFAESFFGKGTLDTALRFIKLMPDIYISPLYGSQKLAICFDSFEILIKNDQIGNDKEIPFQLFWVSLISSAHQNTRLRESSLQLLQTIMTYLVYTKNENDNNKNIMNCVDEIVNSRNQSDSFNLIISDFEKLMDVDFKNSFCLSIISVLVKGIFGTDMESRKKPIEFFKWCFKMFKSELNTSFLFILPLLIFDNSFYYNSTTYSVSNSAEISSFISNSANSSSKIFEWALNCLDLNDSACSLKSVQDLIFYQFDQRSENEKNWIILFLDRFFGESSCPYCVGVIADTLLYGVDNFGNILCRINKSIIDKCQNMIVNLRSIDGVEKLSTIIASFVDASNKSPVTQTEISKDIYRRIEKEKIGELIVKTVSEMEKLARKR